MSLLGGHATVGAPPRLLQALPLYGLQRTASVYGGLDGDGTGEGAPAGG
jgi:hypothetical protein